MIQCYYLKKELSGTIFGKIFAMFKKKILLNF